MDSTHKVKYSNNYYAKFPKQPKKIFNKAPSMIMALVSVTQNMETSHVLAFCQNGQILVFSREKNFSTVVTKSKIIMPKHLKNRGISIQHAVYDETVDEIYFTNTIGYSCDISVFRLHSQSCCEPNKQNVARILIPEHVVTNGYVESIFVDVINRLLFVCAPHMGNDNISIWSLPENKKDESLCQLLGSIKISDFHPTRCAVFSQPGSGIQMAVSDDNNTYLLIGDGMFIKCLQDCKIKATDPITVNFFSDRSNDCNNLVKWIGIIAEMHVSPSDAEELGYVLDIRELDFDDIGNLWAIEEMNSRIQVFDLNGSWTFIKSGEQARWNCHRIEDSMPTRFCLVKNGRNKAPSIILNLGYHKSWLGIFELSD